MSTYEIVSLVLSALAVVMDLIILAVLWREYIHPVHHNILLITRATLLILDCIFFIFN